jgi:formate/nitrite transporter FocA (FNT family)
MESRVELEFGAQEAIPSAISYFRWLWPAVLGNIIGGVGLVTLLEYGQTGEE